MIRKIALGTANFMTSYNGNALNFLDCKNILLEAYRLGIRRVDTAHAYGCINSVLLMNWHEKMRIITKYSEFDNLPNISFNSTMLLCHDSPLTGRYDRLKKQLNNFRCGFSIYTVKEMEYLLNKKINFDALEIPYSIYDRTFQPYIEMLARKGKIIIARSIYGKGRLFKDPSINLPADQAAEMALTFCLKNHHISIAVAGVDTIEHVRALATVPSNIKKWLHYDYDKHVDTNGIDYQAVAV